MSVRTHRLFVLSVCTALGVGLFGGCCSRCGSRCAPAGPWESPTTQATRALLVVNTAELRILRIDGVNVHPSCIGSDGVREYHIPAGMHTVTATFSYAAPVSGGLTGAIEGAPVTVQHQFVAGHEYVPFYREHSRSVPKSEYLLEAIAAAGRSDRYWTLTIADLAQKAGPPEPEVVEARRYCNRFRGLATAPDSSERIRVY